MGEKLIIAGTKNGWKIHLNWKKMTKIRQYRENKIAKNRGKNGGNQKSGQKMFKNRHKKSRKKLKSKRKNGGKIEKIAFIRRRKMAGKNL